MVHQEINVSILELKTLISWWSNPFKFSKSVPKTRKTAAEIYLWSNNSQSWNWIDCLMKQSTFLPQNIIIFKSLRNISSKRGPQKCTSKVATTNLSENPILTPSLQTKTFSITAPFTQHHEPDRSRLVAEAHCHFPGAPSGNHLRLIAK